LLGLSPDRSLPVERFSMSNIPQAGGRYGNGPGVGPETEALPASRRRVSDSMGTLEFGEHLLWGAQTERAVAHFAIGGETMPIELIHALARLKGVAAEVNARLGRIDETLARAIVRAAAEVAEGRHDDQFPLSRWQSGSGTQSHMNVNEVLARLAELQFGGDRAVHPNDEVNLGQSSNDMVPSAMHVAALTALERRLRPAIAGLMVSLRQQAERHADVIKLGRTHLQDAVPLTLGQEIGGWRSALLIADAAIEATRPALHGLAVGGTAVGTGLNTHPDFGNAVCAELARNTGTPYVVASDAFAALSGHEPLVALHGALKVLAVVLTRIANDVRLLASGPRGGLGELVLPANEPGSSIMPGKVNPTQCEALVMVCAQVVGNDAAVTWGAAAGHLQLNTCKPLIIANVLRSLRLLADAIGSFDRWCVQGLQADRPRIAQLLANSLMLVTALTPHIGYDRAARIAHRAHADRTSLRDAALADGIAEAEFERWADPRSMTTVSNELKFSKGA
jgi:fumarate hydratase class II